MDRQYTKQELAEMSDKKLAKEFARIYIITRQYNKHCCGACSLCDAVDDCNIALSYFITVREEVRKRSMA